MTTVQTMLEGLFRPLLLAALAAACVCMGACAGERELRPPAVLTSPYDSNYREPVIAVAPFINESGTSAVDPLRVADAFSAQLTEVRGLSALPINTTIRAMQRLNMGAVRTPGDAMLLASALDADGVVVGVVTAYDPYEPPKLGLTVVLHMRTDPGRLASAGVFDPATLSVAASDTQISPSLYLEEEPAMVARHYDGAGHDIQLDVRRFAEGRHDYDSALGWRRYLASMDLYTTYAAHASVRNLLDAERRRLARARVAGVAEQN